MFAIWHYNFAHIGPTYTATLLLQLLAGVPQGVGVNINSLYCAVFYKSIALNKKNTGMLTQEGFCFVGGASFF